MTAITHTSKRDKWIPWYFVAFFLSFMTVDAVFVTLAVKTHSGVVTEHPYEEGLAYNRIIDGAEKQKTLGWKAAIVYEHDTLRFHLQDGQRRNLAGADVRAKLTRPINADYDRTLDLKETAPGLYSVKVKLPMPGLWNVRIFSKWNGHTYQQSQTLMIERH